MNPNVVNGGESTDSLEYNKHIALAYSGSLEQGYINFMDVRKINTSNRSTVDNSNSSSNQSSLDGSS
jgi:hypothetical protein